MAEFPISSIPLTSGIGVTDPADTFATHYDYLGQGGHRGVSSTAARNAITADRRNFGMLVATQDDGKLWMLKNIAMGGVSNTLTDNSNWIEFTGGSGTGFVPGSDAGGDTLLVGSAAASGGFSDVIVFGQSTATADGQVVADPSLYSSVRFPYLATAFNGFSIGTSSSGFFGDTSQARIFGSTGGQNTLILNNTTNYEFALGNYASGATNSGGIWFKKDGNFASMAMNSIQFMRFDGTLRTLKLGDVDSDDTGELLTIDIANNVIETANQYHHFGKAAGIANFIAGNPSGGVTNEFMIAAPDSRYYFFGEDGSNYSLNNANIEFNNGGISLFHGGYRYIDMQPGVGVPESSRLVIGDVDGGFNATTLTIDDEQAVFTFTQALYSANFNPGGYSGRPSISYTTSSGAIQFGFPEDLGTAGYVLKTDGYGGAYWDPAGSGSGVTSVGAFGSASSSADGATISGTTITFQSATTSHPGMVNTGAQTFAGDKIFDGSLNCFSSTGAGFLQLSLPTSGLPAMGSSNNVRLYNSAGALGISFAIGSRRATISQGFTADRAFTLPNADGTFALTTAIATTGTDLTWSAAGGLAVPSASATARGVITTGTQTIAGAKTLSAKTTFATPTTSIASVNFPTGSDPTTPAAGDVWHNSTQKALFAFLDGVKQSINTILFTQSAGVTVANTTTETSAIGTGVGTKTLPANFWAVGKSVWISGRGVYGTTAIAPNLTIRVKQGTTLLASITLNTLLSSATNAGWMFDCQITCRSNGVTGTLMIDGNVQFENGVMTRGFATLGNGTSTVTFDTTASGALDVTATWSAASAANTLTTNQSSIEIFN